MRKALFLPAAAILILGVASCRTPDVSSQAVDGAVRLEDWEGVNNVFRDGSVYFAGQPDESSLRRFADEEGVATVINLRQPQEMNRIGFDEPDVVASLGMRYVSIPVTPGTFVSEDVDRLANVLAETDEPVLIHCASSNRVGGMWAAYLVEHDGAAVDDAIRIGKSAGLRSPAMVEATRRVASQLPVE